MGWSEPRYFGRTESILEPLEGLKILNFTVDAKTNEEVFVLSHIQMRTSEEIIRQQPSSVWFWEV